MPQGLRADTSAFSTQDLPLIDIFISQYLYMSHQPIKNLLVLTYEISVFIDQQQQNINCFIVFILMSVTVYSNPHFFIVST